MVTLAYVYVEDEDYDSWSWNQEVPDDHSCMFVNRTLAANTQTVQMCSTCKSCDATEEQFQINAVPYSPLLKLEANSRALDYEMCAVYIAHLVCVDRKENPRMDKCFHNQDVTNTSVRQCLDVGISAELVVVVNDLDEPPVGLLISNNAIQENSRSGTLVGSFEVIDPDNESPHQLNTTSEVYELTLLRPDLDSSVQSFYIHDGSLYVLKENIDYESTPKHLHTLNVSVVEARTSFRLIQTVTIDILDVPEPPCCITLQRKTHIQLPKTTHIGTTIGTLQVTLQRYYFINNGVIIIYLHVYKEHWGRTG